jgi:hypothetical protein
VENNAIRFSVQIDGVDPGIRVAYLHRYFDLNVMICSSFKGKYD